MGFVCNMRHSCNDAMLRREAGLETAQHLLSFAMKSQRFRLPGISPEDYVRYGVGNKGLFISVSKDTGSIQSLALRTEAACDKDMCFLSSLVHGITSLSEEVADFTLQDGVELCTCLILLCNPEPLLHALYSGEYARAWHTRHVHPGGLIGIMVHLARQRHGSLLHGGLLRRFQPFLNTPTKDLDKIVVLVEEVLQVCLESQGKRWDVADIDLHGEYDATVRRFQKAYRGREDKGDVNLTMHHLLHALVMCGFHSCKEFISIAQVSLSNSNSRKRTLGYVVGAKERSAQRSRMDIVLKQASLYLSAVFGCFVSVAMAENIYCEADRRECGIDPFLPGQTFFRLEGTKIMRYLPQWDPYRKCVKVVPMGEFAGVRVTSWEQRRKLVAGSISLRLPSPLEERTELPVLATRDIVGPATMEAIKSIMFSPRRNGEPSSVHFQRVCAEVEDLGVVEESSKGRKNSRNRHPRTEVETANAEWNNAAENEEVLQALAQVRMELEVPPLPTSMVPPPHPQMIQAPQQPNLQRATQNLQATQQEDLHQPPDDLMNWPVGEIDLEAEEGPRKRKKNRWDSKTPGLIQKSPPVGAQGNRKPPAAPCNSPPQKRVAFFPADPIVIPTNFNPNRTLRPEAAVIDIEGHETNQEQREKTIEFFPNLVDDSGRHIKLDYSAKNLERICKVKWFGLTRLLEFPCRYPTAKTAFDMFQGRGFKGFSGTKDLMDNISSTPLFPLSNLFDQARTALQSMRRASGNPFLDTFRHSDFQYLSYHKNGFEFYTCSSPTKLPGIDLNPCKECLLRDKVASLQGGVPVENENGRMVWGFQHKETALNFFLLCLIVAGSSSQHFGDTHRAARGKFIKRLRQGLGSKVHSRWNAGEKKTFVAAFVRARDYEKIMRGEQIIPVPYYFVIGNRNGDHPQQAWKVKHDFSLVIPDVPFISRHYLENGKRPGKRESKGEAMYIRPAQASKCYFVNEPPPLPPQGHPLAGMAAAATQPRHPPLQPMPFSPI